MQAIKVNDSKTQKEINRRFGTMVPLYLIYYPKENFYNSSLWFEMWRPSIDIVSLNEYKDYKISDIRNSKIELILKKPWYKKIFNL